MEERGGRARPDEGEAPKRPREEFGELSDEQLEAVVGGLSGEAVLARLGQAGYRSGEA